MKIREIKENKKQFLSLLLLADEQYNLYQIFFLSICYYIFNKDYDKKTPEIAATFFMGEICLSGMRMCKK